MKVSHFNGKVKVGKAEKLKLANKQLIQQQYGESFLQDANYIAIFTQDEADDSSMKKLFELVNRALGKDANNMTQSDFKKASFGGGADEPDDTADDVDDTAETPADDEGNEENVNEDELGGDSFIFMKITVK